MIGLLIFAAAAASAPCSAQPKYHAVAHTGAVKLGNTGQGYSASAHIAFRLNVARRGGGSENVHARGARIIAQRIVSGAGGSVMGFGHTPHAAHLALQADIASLTRDVDATLTRQEQTYDRVTENGRQQDQGPLYGFPGGADVTTFCAR